MPTPPLQRTPNLSRLFGPGEVVVYTAKLHPLHGWPYGLAALIAGWAAWMLWWPLALPALLLAIVYFLPFIHWECAVTTNRLLVRHGRFKIALDAIDPDKLDHCQLHQNTFTSLLHCGTVILNLNAGREHVLHKLALPFLWHPMSFLEALTTLNPQFRAKL